MHHPTAFDNQKARRKAGLFFDTGYKIRTCDPIRVKDVLYH